MHCTWIQTINLKMPKRKNKQSQPEPSVQPEQQNKSTEKFVGQTPTKEFENSQHESSNLSASNDPVSTGGPGIDPVISKVDVSLTPNEPEPTQDPLKPNEPTAPQHRFVTIPTESNNLIDPNISQNDKIYSMVKESQKLVKKTLSGNFLTIPVVVRANGHEVRALAINKPQDKSTENRLTDKLFEELELSNTNNDVTISSLDDFQIISCKVGPGFHPKKSEQSFYKNEASRLWPHLFGENQLPLQTDVVQVQLDINMTNALRYSALTTSQIFGRWECGTCLGNYKFGQNKSHSEKSMRKQLLPERIGTSNPKEDQFWLMDQATYIIAILCPYRRLIFINTHKKLMENRAQLVKNGKDKRIAEGNYEDDPWYMKVLKCLFPYYFR